jgi:hypothetical protein
MPHDKESPVAETSKEQPQQPDQMPASDPEINEKIAILAYRLWHERGCPLGSPGEDWFRAERILQGRWTD